MLNRKRRASPAAKTSAPCPSPAPHSPFPIPHSPFPTRILGIDPGLNITGYGVLERNEKNPKQPRVIEAGVIRGNAKQSLEDRLAEIHAGVADCIATLKPGVMALEQLYSHVAHPRTSILMGHARGVICLAAAQAGIAVIHYPSTQIKRILTGNGRASKEQMQLAIQRELRLDELPDPPDVADALAVAVCHYYLGRREQESALANEQPASRL
ncbi:MAG TPA: crossover junction endodeoxyribonuclease RuvC [Pirellulales bacterium]|jgi:crossover junction endodeoxyribonuclease RuvC|nr:crossover junction endodeoxyribonuclease RuvC [Pirellulales bacterium]